MNNNRKAVLATVLLFFLALGITVYPVVSNFLCDRHRSLVETAYFESVEQLDDETIRKARQEAEEYNALLSKGISGDLNNEEMNTYNNILNVNGDGIMAYIRIPAIDIDLPISHGTGAKILENYVGHVVGSSLPVGGESTHAVISGHSGMAGQRMFTDLHQLKSGDMVYKLSETSYNTKPKSAMDRPACACVEIQVLNLQQSEHRYPISCRINKRDSKKTIRLRGKDLNRYFQIVTFRIENHLEMC